MTDWLALDYRPHIPATGLGIGMIGCGGIAGVAASAYRAAGLRVTAVCDVNRAAATRFRDEYFPTALVFDDHRDLLDSPGVDVVDIATHTAVRAPLIRDALTAGKHVQSQKPFVFDLAEGEQLCDLADRNGVVLTVNQNARWSPHFAYLLAAARSGALGAIASADFELHWDHDSAVVGTPFATMDDLVLLDFGIHWFDLVSALMGGRRAQSVYALTTSSSDQVVTVPTLAGALIDFGDAQASLLFRASSRNGEEGRYRVDGSLAAVLSDGPALGGDHVTVLVDGEQAIVPVMGQWMPDGLGGTMGELLAAIAEGRTPTTSARTVLEGLRLCFAALESARTRREVRPGDVTGAN